MKILCPHCKTSFDFWPYRSYGSISPVDRFWEKVDKRGPNECWNWKAATLHYGHGSFGGFPSGETQAHRISWTLHHGPIPKGLCVCHKCDNPSCVNPAHLFLGTRADNIYDMMAKGRQVPPRGERCAQHKLTAAQVQDIKEQYATGEVSQRALAKEFKVGQQQIHRIVSGKRWNHLATTEKLKDKIRKFQKLRCRRNGRVAMNA